MEKDIHVVGFTRHGAPEDMLEADPTEVRSYEALKAELALPRTVFLCIPAGPPVDEILNNLTAALGPGTCSWTAAIPTGETRSGATASAATPTVRARPASAGKAASAAS